MALFETMKFPPPLLASVVFKVGKPLLYFRMLLTLQCQLICIEDSTIFVGNGFVEIVSRYLSVNRTDQSQKEKSWNYNESVKSRHGNNRRYRCKLVAKPISSQIKSFD